MIGDELLPKLSPDKNQRLVMIINGIYEVEYGKRIEFYMLPILSVVLDFLPRARGALFGK